MTPEQEDDARTEAAKLEARLKHLIRSRGAHRGVLRKRCNESKDKTLTNDAELRSFEAKLELIHQKNNQILQLDGEILLLTENEVRMNKEVDETSAFEEEIADNLAILNNIKESYTVLANSQRTSAGPSAQAGSVKLPKLTVPTFTGSYTDWTSFWDHFSSLVHNTTIPKVEKLSYLKLAVKGAASRELSSYQTTEGNYDLCVTRLKELYDNKRCIVKAHLDALFSYSKLKNESAQNLRSLLEHFNDHVRSLKNLGMPTDQWDAILTHVLGSKLDPEARKHWELDCPGTDIQTYDAMTKFLDNRRRALESSESSNGNRNASSSSPATSYQRQSNNQGNQSYYSNRSSTKGSYVTGKVDSCIVSGCNLTHRLSSCSNFRALQQQQRFEIVKSNRLCYNCLMGGHSIRECTSKYTCRTCSEKHHSLLHRFKNPSSEELNSTHDSTSSNHCSHSNNTPNSQSQPPPNLTVTVPTKASNTCATSTSAPVDVLLATVRITPVGSAHHLRALLDSGSQCNFIRDNVARAMGLPFQKNNTLITGVGNISSTPNSSVLLDIGHGLKVHCLVVPSITQSMPANEIDLKPFKRIHNLKLADPDFNKPGQIDLLLGAEVYDEIMLDTKLKDEELFLKETLYGYVVAGPLRGQSPASLASYTCHIDANLEKFWELESVPNIKWLSPEEKECEEHYTATTVIDTDGRAIVRLPFKCERTKLGSNRQSAERRFYSLERRLNLNKPLKEQYVAFINEFISMGHLKEAPPSQGNQEYYLPHHCVEKDSTTTKLRVVFDASAKTSSGKSLNDCLLVGPRVQSDLFSIVIRFRFHRYALSADIAKMYRQIALAEEDQDLHRLLWREDSNLPLKSFRMVRVTYGVASSSYHSTRALQECGNTHASGDVKEAITNDFYVDDFLGGKPTLEEAKNFQDKLIEVLAKGQFPLRKFSSNCAELVTRLPQELQEAGEAFKIQDHDHAIKALGIKWKPLNDEFCFTTNFNTSKGTITKRLLLSEISRLFDPLGWLTSITISMKILMQQTWLYSIDWDDELPVHLKEAFETWASDLKVLSELKIPRCILANQKHETIELHLFCDASEKAYAACVYTVVRVNNEEATVNLLVAKSKVTPVKPISIPRLELCAMHLGAKLLETVTETLKKLQSPSISSTHAWTDSTVALAWVHSEPRKWCTFVANRCTDIQSRLPDVTWNHVSTHTNPADVGSRGISACQIMPNTELGLLWWKGPAWLRSGTPPDPQSFETTEEMKKESKVALLTSKISKSNALIDITRFSSLAKILRVLAYCKRWKTKAKGPITLAERRSALMSLVVSEQNLYYQEERKQIKENKQVDKNATIASLYPFIDDIDQGVLRVGGRLAQSNLHVETRFPLLIPRSSPLAMLITLEAHQHTLHGPAQLMMSQIRQKFWIVRGIEIVKKVIRACVKCTRFASKPVEQLMGDLPAYRVNIPPKAFTHVGLDFAGPFTMKDRKGEMKAYVCLFICLASKAIHIELAIDLSSLSCLAAIKRFIARRGLPKVLMSDNGTNFVGIRNELMKKGQQLPVVWNLIPPASPHFGGIWEAGVKSTKHHLRRVLGSHQLTQEELTTLLCQIEQILNSRPLGTLTDAPDDILALTPAHLCGGTPLNFFPEADTPEVPESEGIQRITAPKKRWLFTKNLLNNFWTRWSKEYVTTLQQRKKWKREDSNLKVGDVVYVADDNQSPLNWPLGRVIQAYAGRDSFVRVAKVKTPRGILTRPITKLRKLPSVEAVDTSRPGVCSDEQQLE